MSRSESSDHSSSPDLPSTSQSNRKRKRKHKRQPKPQNSRESPIYTDEEESDESNSQIKKNKSDSTISQASSETKASYCDICKKSIKGNSFHLRRHFNLVHDHKKKDEKPEGTKCPLCPRYFERNLVTHLKEVHNAKSANENKEGEPAVPRNPFIDDEATVDGRDPDEIEEAEASNTKKRAKGSNGNGKKDKDESGSSSSNSSSSNNSSNSSSSDGYVSDGEAPPPPPIPGPQCAIFPGPSVDSWPNVLDDVPKDYSNPDFFISPNVAQSVQSPIEKDKNGDSDEIEFDLRLDEPDSDFDEQNAPDPYLRIEGGTDHKPTRPLSPKNVQNTDDGERETPTPMPESPAHISDDGREQGTPSPIQQSDGQITDSGDEGASSAIEESDGQITDSGDEGASSSIEESDGQITDDGEEEEGAPTPMPESDAQITDDDGEEQAMSPMPKSTVEIIEEPDSVSQNPDKESTIESNEASPSEPDPDQATTSKRSRLSGTKNLTGRQKQERNLIGKERFSELNCTMSLFACLATYFICLSKKIPISSVKRFLKEAKSIFNETSNALSIKLCDSSGIINFGGLKQIGQYHQIIIEVFNENKDRLSRLPPFDNKLPVLNLLLDGNGKFCIIKNEATFFSEFICPDCQSSFSANFNLRRHITGGRCPYQIFFEKYPNATDFDYHITPIQDYLVKNTFTGGKTQPKWSFAERLAKIGIYLPDDFEVNEYFAVSDIESYLFAPPHKDSDGEDEQGLAVLEGSNLIFKETHKPACVAAISNLEDYRRAKCFLDVAGSNFFLEKCLDYLYEISEAAFDQNMKRHKKLFKKMDKQIKIATENSKGGLAVQIERLKKDMIKHARQLPVLFFNLTYDMSALVREGGLAYLLYKKDKAVPRALKNINQWISLTSDSLRFLDICNYGSGKSPLSDFLYSYGVPDEGSKLYFPYASLSEPKDMMKLIADMKYEHFWSDLKQENVLETGRRKYENYIEMGLDEKSALQKMKRTSVPKTGEDLFRELIQFCQEHNMTYLCQYLSLYCCMDVVGLVIAVTKMKQSFFKLANIDVLSFCTLPSLSYTWALKEIAQWETDDNGLKFVVKLDKDAFEIIEEGIKGGSSTVLKRLAVAGMTKIREHRLPPEAVKKVQNIIYFDFNMLYGSSALSPMPVLGNYSIRRKEEDFRMTEVNGRGIMAISWLEFQSKLVHKQPMRTILSVFSEKTLLLENNQRARLDGWITTGKNKKGQCIGYSFEYHGAVVHSNPSVMSEEEFEHGLNPLNKKPNKEVYEATLARDKLIEKHPLVVKHFVVWSFEWEEQIRNEPIVRAFVEENRFSFRPDPVKEEMNWEELLDLICREKVHGVVKCSLVVPRDQYDRFSIYPPFWLHKDLSRKDLCPSEKEYAEKYDLLKISTKKTLCHEMKVEDGVITTDLLKFYVADLGLSCTDISVIIQFRGAGRPLLNWLNKNIERREFARTHNQPVEGQTAKLTLNTFFGTSILKAESRRLVTFALSEKLKRYFCRPAFNGMFQAGPPNDPSAMYEIEMLKMNVQQSSSKQIGMWILQVSKMSLLDFVYNVLDKYLKPDCWEINGSDTDSIVLSVSTPGTDMRDIAKPEMVEELDAKYDKIFVTKPEDSHVPLLLKVEKEAKIFIGLASKTYLMVGDNPFHKQASKGISATKENMQVIDLENYMSTLFDVGERKRATIRGIRNDKEKSLRTYSMSKTGLSRFAPKVGYHSCHICPFPREFKDQPNDLSDIYPYACTELDFDSVWEHIVALSHQFPDMHLNLD